MLNAALLLLCQSMFWSLHLAGGSGSFPRPLTAEEERQYLELCAKGDLDARNVLVERNLRLVAHIIKLSIVFFRFGVFGAVPARTVARKYSKYKAFLYVGL